VIALFDTSVLVAALVEAHPHHAVAFPWLRRAHSGAVQGLVCAHGLAETFAVLTTLPHLPRIPPEAARQVIRESVEAKLRVVPLGAADYSQVLRRLAGAGLSAGIVYDALAARAAEKRGAERIVTLNRRDFDRVAPLFGVGVTAP
jgi:predicted nucleic acid-binding protein